jgi:hypothetical protein
VLDIVELPVSHTGKNLAEAFAGVMIKFGIQDKVSLVFHFRYTSLIKSSQVLSITCDNASNNDTMIAELVPLLPGFKGDENRTRCFAHILNLVVKRILSLFDDDSEDAAQSAEKRLQSLASAVDLESEDEDEDNNSPDRSVPIPVDAEMEEICQGEDLDAIRASIAPVRTVIVKVSHLTHYQIPGSDIVKLRRLAYAILKSTTIALPAWRLAVSTAGLPPRLIPRDVSTRWNATYLLLQFAMEYKVPINAVCDDRTLALRSFSLDDDEWDIVDQLTTVLAVRAHFTTTTMY